MSSNWSTTPQMGSVNSGFDGSGQQQAVIGGAAPAFEVENFNIQNVNYDASITPPAAAQRQAQRYDRLAAVTAGRLKVLNTPGQPPNVASAAARTAPLVFGTGTRFNNSSQ